jgi:hypothetical protein
VDGWLTIVRNRQNRTAIKGVMNRKRLELAVLFTNNTSTYVTIYVTHTHRSRCLLTAVKIYTLKTLQAPLHR